MRGLPSGEVTSERIGRAVLEGYSELDVIAAVRFASVYKGFDDLADFERELTLLTKRTAPKPATEGGENRRSLSDRSAGAEVADEEVVVGGEDVGRATATDRARARPGDGCGTRRRPRAPGRP